MHLGASKNRAIFWGAVKIATAAAENRGFLVHSINANQAGWERGSKMGSNALWGPDGSRHSSDRKFLRTKIPKIHPKDENSGKIQTNILRTNLPKIPKLGRKFRKFKLLSGTKIPKIHPEDENSEKVKLSGTRTSENTS